MQLCKTQESARGRTKPGEDSRAREARMGLREYPLSVCNVGKL